MIVLVPIAIIFAAVFIHEAAHGLTAFAFGVKPKSISIGIPVPPKKEFKLKGGTTLTISPWLLLGSMVPDEEAFEKLPYMKKVLVFVSGPIMNLFAGIVVAVLVYGMSRGTEVSREMAAGALKSAELIVTGQVPIGAVSGPVGLVDFGTKMMKINLELGSMLLWLFVSFALGVLNLLPIPGLDGGQIVTSALSSASGRSKKVVLFNKIITTTSLVVILAFLFLVTVKDIYNLF